MQKYKKLSIGLLLAVLMVSVAFAYSLWLLTIGNQMHITVYKELAFEHTIGTAITTWDWGDFNRSANSKVETFYLRNLSNQAINCTYNVTGLDPAFSFSLDVEKFEFTTYNEIIPFVATLNLTDFSKPAGDFAFDLEFGEE